MQFEIEGAFESFFLCHCGRCRKDTGSAHAANLFSTTAAVTWRNGEEKIAHYQIPDTRHAKSFCSVCGAALPSIQMGGALLVVPAGSLDGEVEISPVAHICTASRARWEDAMRDIPRLEGLPA
ncbi:GFA family protein [Altererythrobacter fulvus]|uniref:GFA family protein n=1 Tax=Caenibius fulvus TaxID=2126012 RepID=UPI003016CE0F